MSAIRPRLERLLSRGASRWYLRGMLFYWRLRYRLSALTLQSNGEIVARVNPSAVATRARKVTIGNELLRIFAEVEAQYRDILLGREGTEESQAEAVEGLRTRQERPLGESGSRFEQAEALRSAESLGALPRRRRRRPGQPKPSRRGPRPLEVEENVRMSAADPRHLGTAVVSMGGLSSYRAMMASLRSNMRALNIPSDQMARILSARPAEFRTRIAELRTMASGLPAARRDAFIGTVQRMGFLTQSLEPARRGGVGVASSLGFTLAGRRREGGVGASVDEVVSGQLAPMAPRGAASRRNTPRTRAARRTTAVRVHNIFRRLADMAQHADIMAPASGGFDLTRLANAAKRWLDMKIRRIDDAAELERQEDIIRVELLAFFSRYHGG